MRNIIAEHVLSYLSLGGVNPRVVSPDAASATKHDIAFLHSPLPPIHHTILIFLKIVMIKERYDL